MVLAFDTWYFDKAAKTVCVVIEEWSAPVLYKVYSEIYKEVDNYIPGEFYRRELPCILSLWHRVEEKDVEAIIIDGFVYLDDDGRYGLGGHLYEQLGRKIPIIRVAKTDFVPLQKNKRCLWRGKSKRPLYITSVGINLDIATEYIKSMAGQFRIPALLKELDRLTRQV